jgi:hypothetical protein
MDNYEIGTVEVVNASSDVAQTLVTLSDLELAFIGGGIGDTIL